MDATPTECPNCHTPLKSSLFNSVALLPANQTRLINAVNDSSTTAHCNKCGSALYSEAKGKVEDEMKRIQQSIVSTINYIPVISAQNPLGWDYEVLTMVTGQSTTGTGVFPEFTSSINDLFGQQSGAYNNKLKGGEQLCFAQLRKQTIEMGGNAVIATDIDYSEVGGDKGMLMVCMAGTAIRLKNLNVLGENRLTQLERLVNLNSRLKELKSLAATGQ